MKVLIQIYKSAKKYWGHIVFAAVTMLLITGANLIIPRLTQNMVKILEENTNADDSMHRIVVIALILLVAYAVRAVLQFFQNYISHVAAWNYVAELRVKIYDHLQRLSIGYYHDKQTGQLMSRVINDTGAFETLIAHAIPDLASSIIMFVSVTVILFTTNVKLAALTCIPLPFILLTIPVMKRIRAMHKEAQIHIAELNSKLQDNFSGIKEIQIFNKHDDEYGSVMLHSKNHADSLLKALFYSAIIHPSIGLLTSLGNVIVVGVGGYIALSGQGLEINQIVGFLLYLSMFYGPVSSLARIVEDMQAGIAGGERVFEILNSETEIHEDETKQKLINAKGNISFRNVSFEYNSDSTVLENLNIEMKAKKMYAIVGPTGVGKTTLTALIPRFYDVTEGELLIDGINIKDLTLKSLRDNISMVLQDVFLFHGTIKENIVYGCPNATDEEVEAAAKMACIHNFVDRLPEKYDTIVGERGVRLSGGQKQRISIARSLLCKTPILILDEATSSVDTETEQEIQKAIQQIAGSCTMIVIAHRLSTVKKADTIIVLDEKTVKETGSHEELIAQDGLYKHLVDIQSMKEANLFE